MLDVADAVEGNDSPVGAALQFGVNATEKAVIITSSFDMGLADGETSSKEAHPTLSSKFRRRNSKLSIVRWKNLPGYWVRWLFHPVFWAREPHTPRRKDGRRPEGGGLARLNPTPTTPSR